MRTWDENKEGNLIKKTKYEKEKEGETEEGKMKDHGNRRENQKITNGKNNKRRKEELKHGIYEQWKCKEWKKWQEKLIDINTDMETDRGVITIQEVRYRR